MAKAIAANGELTVAEAARRTGLTATEIAEKLHCESSEKVTAKLIQEAVVNGTLKEAQAAQILQTEAQTAANVAGAASFKTLGASIKATAVAMLTTPAGWITLLTSVVPLAITLVSKLYDWLTVTKEEAYAAAQEHTSAYEELTDEVEDLNTKLEDSKERLQELMEASENGTITLMEQEELDKLKEANDELEKQITYKKYLAEQEAAEADKGYEEAYDKEKVSYDFSDRYRAEQEALEQQLNELYQSGTDESLSQAVELEERLRQVKQAINDNMDEDHNLLSGAGGITDVINKLIEEYERLEALKDSGVDFYDENGELNAYGQYMESVKTQLAEMQQKLDTEYITPHTSDNEAEQEWTELYDTIGRTIFATEYFAQKMDELPTECQDKLKSIAAEAGLTEDNIEELADQFPELRNSMDATGAAADDVAAYFNSIASAEDDAGESTGTYEAKLSSLKDVLSDLKTSYSALESAEEDMADGGGLSTDTIDALASANDNYLDYLYEENGVIKLNTEAWKENASAKMQNEMSEIQKEIDSLKERNKLLQEDTRTVNVGKMDASVDSDVLKELQELGEGGTVDVTIRPVIDTSELNAAGWDEDGDYATILTNTFTDETETIAMNFTPIMTDENGNYIGTLSPEELQSYAEGVIAGVRKDDLRLQIGAKFTGDDAIEQAEAAAQEIHEAHEKIIEAQGGDFETSSQQVSNNTAEIEQNNASIAENQALLDKYGAIFDTITGKQDSLYTVMDAYTASMENLAKVQDAVANGYTISVDTARELAAMYPELLNGATEAANGMISLNEQEVNAVIAGKQAEYQSSIQAQIDELSAKKSVLEQELALIDAQIAAAQSGDAAAVQSASEASAAQIALEQAVLSACEQSGIDETTANQLATAAMTGDWDTFKTLAEQACYDLDDESAISFTNVMNNFAATVQNIIGNSNKAINAFSQMGTALSNAMKGLTTGEYTGKAIAGSVEGDGKEAFEGTLKSLFEDMSSDYGDSGTKYKDALAGWQKSISDAVKNFAESNTLETLQAQRKSVVSEISTIKGQIQLLNSLKNKPLTKFSSGSAKSGSGSGKSSSSSAKEVEEYIAEIDKFREAEERLRKTQETASQVEEKIENTGDLKAQIVLQRELTDTYERQQKALENLNIQRIRTILEGAESLRGLGFDVDYDYAKHELWINNLEHLNELTADSKGEYDTLQEATNALRENTEDLIDSLNDLNEENREGAQTWTDLKYSIEESKGEIDELLTSIVENASETVDSIQSIYDTLHEAADQYAASGYITVDNLQSIIGLGQKYVAYLVDENGQLVINEEAIRNVIAARTQEMAIESSLSYIEALRIARSENDIETLNNLLYATESATDATWGYVYASLALAGLDETQYQAALQNINALRALADSACESIGQTASSVTDELENMQDGLDDILQYVMDMLKQRVNDQIDALEDMKDQYASLIDLKKESLEASKDEADYQKTMASKLKEIAKLQARIDALSLDDSREAQAEKAELLDEMAELQEDLAETQADKAVEATEDALDKQQEAYEKEKDEEIAILEDSISSYQKLYDMA